MDVLVANNKFIKDIVRTHKSAFPNFFLTELGDDFLKLYYRSVLASRNGVLLVCLENEKVIGFCAACIKSAGFNSSLIKDNFFKFSAIGIKLLFSNPKSLFRLYKNLTKHGDNNDNGDYAELMSIGVSNEIQNKGVGKLLLGKLENNLKDKGVTTLSLTTDTLDNEKTLGFYSKCGFTKWYEFVTYPNRRMNRLIKQIK